MFTSYLSAPIGATLESYSPKTRFSAPPVFQIRPDTSDQKAIDEVFIRKAYQRPKSGFVVEPGDCWLDLGANVGAFSVFAFKSGAKVVSVEAEATNARLASANITANGFPSNTICAAVVPDSYQSKEITLHVNSEPLSLRRHSVNKARRKSEPRTVDALRFSDLVGDGFDCLKVNVEGAEIQILSELQDFSKIRKLVFEWSFDIEPRMAVLAAVLEKLRASFDWVGLSKSNLPFHLDKYPFYPPSVYCYCLKTGGVK